MNEKQKITLNALILKTVVIIKKLQQDRNHSFFTY